MIFLDWVLLINSAILISLVALQQSKGDLGEALTGAKSELFKNQKERGIELFLSRSTLVAVIVLVVLAAVRIYISKYL